MAFQNIQQIHVQEKLEQRIVYGLACEWETGFWMLEEKYRQIIRKPMFALYDFKRRLGSWSKEKKQIALSRDFVLNHSWQAVRDVLLHEMAHQLSDFLHPPENEPAHGQTFIKACRLLKANPNASGDYRSLRTTSSFNPQTIEDKMLIRIKKLLSLAQSNNKNEAEAAMLKAHELIGKYNIKFMKQNPNRRFTSIFLGLPALRHTRDAYHLAQLLMDYYFVQGLWISSFVLEKGKMGRVLEISGTRQNVKISVYIYRYIRQFIDSQWRRYNKGKNLSHHRKTDFSIGIINGFRSKLELQKQKKGHPRVSKSLIKIDDPRLAKYMAQRYPYTRSIRRYVTTQNEKVIEDGEKIGKNLIISKGITEKKENRILKINGPLEN